MRISCVYCACPKCARTWKASASKFLVRRRRRSRHLPEPTSRSGRRSSRPLASSRSEERYDMQLTITEATDVAVRALTRVGMQESAARTVADHLVDANLCGHEFSSL